MPYAGPDRGQRGRQSGTPRAALAQAPRPAVYLARSPRQARSREHLIGMLWGDRTESAARHSLSEALRVIRRHAGLAAVELTVGQVRLFPDGGARCRPAGALIADEDWAGASDLAGGEFLEGFAVPDASGFEDWLAAERELWRRRRVEVLVRAAEALSRWEGATGRRYWRDALSPSSRPPSRLSIRGPLPGLAGDRAGALELFDRFSARSRSWVSSPATETLDPCRSGAAWAQAEPRVQAAYIHDPSVVRPPLVGREEEFSRLLEGAARSARTRRPACSCSRASRGSERPGYWRRRSPWCAWTGCRLPTARTVEADRTEPWSGVLALARGGIIDAPGVGAAPPAALAAFAELLPEWAERFAARR